MTESHIPPATPQWPRYHKPDQGREHITSKHHTTAPQHQSIPEQTKSGHHPALFRTAAARATGIRADVRGMAIRLVMMKYRGAESKSRNASGPVNIWHAMDMAALSQTFFSIGTLAG